MASNSMCIRRLAGATKVPVLDLSRDIHPLTDFKTYRSEFLRRLKQRPDSRGK